MSYILHWHEKTKGDLVGIAKFVAGRFSKATAEMAVRQIREEPATLSSGTNSAKGERMEWCAACCIQKETG